MMQSITDSNGVERFLGNLAAPVRFNWRVYGDTPDAPLIPRDQWEPVDLSSYLPPVYDQDSIGACNAFDTITLFESCRAIQGLEYVHLSPGYLYGNINGQQDQGSFLEDALTWMVEKGSCPATMVGDLAWQRSKWPAGAAAAALPYRIIEAYWCPEFEHLASAAQFGFFLSLGVLWHSNYNPDPDGWLPERGSGGGGGHAICGYGLAKRGSKWGIPFRNSWGAWGQAGNAILPEAAFSGPVGGWWACRVTTATPEDPIPSPAQ